MNLNNLIALMTALARLAKECHFANSEWQRKIAVLASISKTLAKVSRKIAFAIAANLAIISVPSVSEACCHVAPPKNDFFVPLPQCLGVRG
jgi:hypothetical protein